MPIFSTHSSTMPNPTTPFHDIESDSDDEDVWFDAEHAFPEISPISMGSDIKPVSLGEDAQRCIKQLLQYLGELTQNQIISIGFSTLFPHIPIEIIQLSDSLYSAIINKKDIDIAILNILGITNSYLLSEGNLLSKLTEYTHQIITKFIDESYLNFDYNRSYSFNVYLSMAIFSLVTQYWITNKTQPQRTLFRLPLFMTKLLIRVHYYWKRICLFREASHDTKTIQPQSTFEIDTCIELTQKIKRSSLLPFHLDRKHNFIPPAYQENTINITHFISNSTIKSDRIIKAIVSNNVNLKTPNQSNDLGNSIHSFALSVLSKKSEISNLFSCVHKQTKYLKFKNDKTILYFHMNTQCDALPFKAEIVPIMISSKNERSLKPTISNLYMNELSIKSSISHFSSSHLVGPLSTYAVAHSSLYLQQENIIKTLSYLGLGVVSFMGSIIGSKYVLDAMLLNQDTTKTPAINFQEYIRDINIIKSIVVPDLWPILNILNSEFHQKEYQPIHQSKRVKRSNLIYSNQIFKKIIDYFEQSKNIHLRNEFMLTLQNIENDPKIIYEKNEATKELLILVKGLDTIIDFINYHDDRLDLNLFKKIHFVIKKMSSKITYQEIMDLLSNMRSTLFNKIFPFTEDWDTEIKWTLAELNDQLITKEFLFILNKVSSHPEVRDAKNLAQQRLNQILKSIQYIYAFLKEMQLTADPIKQSIQLPKWNIIMDKLWEMGSHLNNKKNQFLVTQYKNYLVFQDNSEQVLSDIQEKYNFIFNIKNFINNQIYSHIKQYEKMTKTKIELTPESLIEVVFYKRNGFVRDTIARNYTLFDIATGQAQAHIKTLLKTDKAFTNYFMFGYRTYHEDLITTIDHNRDVLQEKIEKALIDYRNQINNRNALKLFYENIIRLRCFQYLSDDNRLPLFEKAVTDFLTGNLKAQTVNFHDTPLDDVILIPVKSGGLLMGVNEYIFFHLHEKEHITDFIHKKEIYFIPKIPLTKQFIEWILNKLPLDKAKKYSETDFKYRLYNLAHFPPIINYIFEKPFSFKNTKNNDELTSHILDIAIDRLQSDINTFIITNDEEITQEWFKKFDENIAALSFGFGLIMPAAFSVIGRLAFLLSSLVLDGVFIASSLIQAEHADDPEESQQFRNDAILAGILAGVNTGSSIFSKVFKHTKIGSYDKKEIKNTLKYYKNMKKMSLLATPKVINKMRLNYLPRAIKTEQVEAKHSFMIQTLDRSLSPQNIKPKISDFTKNNVFDKKGFDDAMKQYLESKNTFIRIGQPSDSIENEVKNRKSQAILRLNNLAGSYSNLIDQITIDTGSSFTLTTIKEDPADILVLNAHGWFTKESNNFIIPNNKEILFLGPHGKILLEPAGSLFQLPTEQLLDGTQHPTLYAKLANKSSIKENNFSKFTLLTSGTDKENFIKNYHISHYEKTPLEEIKLSILNNRINNKTKMDILTVNALAGRTKTLKDIVNEMRPGGKYSTYKKLIFFACREEKHPGTLASIKQGLGEGYEIVFSSTPINEQLLTNSQQKRAIHDKNELDIISFDGYYVYEIITLIKKENQFDITNQIYEIFPYLYKNPTSVN